MKSMISYLKFMCTVLAVTFFNAMSIAQESTGTTKVEITADTGNWFTNNWIWVVGVVVFIILLLALMGGGSSRRTTVIREDTGTGRVTRTTTVDDDI